MKTDGIEYSDEEREKMRVHALLNEKMNHIPEPINGVWVVYSYESGQGPYIVRLYPDWGVAIAHADPDYEEHVVFLPWGKLIGEMVK